MFHRGLSELRSDADFVTPETQISRWVLFVEGKIKVAKLVEIDGKPYVIIDDNIVPVEGFSPTGSRGKPELRFELSPDLLDKYRKWLPSEQRRKAARDPETIEKYMGYLRKFYECSNGIIKPETIMKCATNKHYVRALRALIEMLKFYGEIPAPLATEMLERLRWRRNDRVGEDEVPVSKVLESIAFLEERGLPLYRLLYRAMLYSGGIRLEQLLELVPYDGRYWRRSGSVPRPYGRYNAIKALEDRGISSKPIDHIWLPEDVYLELRSLRREQLPRPGAARKYYSRHGLVGPSLLRSFCWQVAKFLLPDKNLARILQGRLGELKREVSAQSYDTLRYQLDRLYPRWMEFVDRLYSAARSSPREEARRIIRDYGLPLPA
jgi:hypothetical protein